MHEDDLCVRFSNLMTNGTTRVKRVIQGNPISYPYKGLEVLQAQGDKGYRSVLINT